MTSKNGSALTPVAETTEVSELHMLTTADILAAEDLPEQVLYVPEWNGSVRIRAFSKGVEQRLRAESGGQANFDMDRFEMLLFIEGVIEPKFELDQMDALKSKNNRPFDFVVGAVMKLAGLTKEAVAEAKATFPSQS